MRAAGKPLRFAVVAGAAAALLAACAGGADEGEEPAAAAQAPAPSAGAPAATPAPGGTAAPPAATLDGDGFGLSRDQLVAVLSERDLAAEAFAPVGNGREVTVASFPETAIRQVLWVGIFGDPEAPHTIRLDFFPIHAGPREVAIVGAALNRLLTAIFPEWPEAGEWPDAAGGRAWRETSELAQQEGADHRVPVFETRRDGASLSALAIPPQFISYVFTTEDACRPLLAPDFLEGYAACR